MRNWAIAGLAVALLPGSASAVTYKSIKEVCLFSSTLPPADSPLASGALGALAIRNGDYDFVREAKTGLAGKARESSDGVAGSVVSTSLISLKGIYERLWYSNAGSKNGAIFGAIQADASNFALREDYSNADSAKPKFRVSGVPAVGVERNGFVAGFEMQY
jgi:hypothetical protein